MYNKKKNPMVMHKIVKSASRANLDYNKLKREHPGLITFINEFYERLSANRDINASFLDDCAVFLLYRINAPTEHIQTYLKLVWDHFDECHINTLSGLIYQLSVDDQEMNNDLTLLFVYRFIERFIEEQKTNEVRDDCLVQAALG